MTHFKRGVSTMNVKLIKNFKQYLYSLI